MNKLIYYLSLPFKYICVGLIYLYKCTISEILPSCCIYQPTCSTYTLIAIQRFGVIKGCFLGAKRILRCRPGKKGGLDPVPDNLKTNLKYKI